MRVVALVIGLLFTTGCEGAREATDAAVRVAAKCSHVTDALGEPLEGSWSEFEQSSSGNSSRIEAHGSIKGPKGNGALQFEALGDGTSWAITRGTVLADGKAIDIVNCKSGVGQ